MYTSGFQSVPPKSCLLSTSKYTDNLTTVDMRKSFVCPGFSSMYVFCLYKQIKLLHAHQIQMGKGKILSEFDFTICFSQSNQINLEDSN